MADLRLADEDPESSIPGLWLPRKVMRRYGPELSSTAGALFDLYQTLYGGQGRNLTIPVEKMLELLAMDDTPECIDKLNNLILRMGHHENVGTRMEHGVINVWFTREVELRTHTYQRRPGGASL